MVLLNASRMLRIPAGAISGAAISTVAFHSGNECAGYWFPRDEHRELQLGRRARGAQGGCGEAHIAQNSACERRGNGEN